MAYSFDQVAEALSAAMAPLFPGVPVIRAQGNRVPMPRPPFILLTELFSADLSTPAQDYRPAVEAIGETDIGGRQRATWQIDFHGEEAGDQCATMKAVFRSPWFADQFPDGLSPLYCDNGIQAPFITAEQQWGGRWTLTIQLQNNPLVTLPQQFADSLSVHTIEVIQ